MKRSYYIWPTILALALALGILLGGRLHFNDTPEKLFTTNSKKDKLNRLIDYIDYEYVDDINTDSIVDVTVNNILDKLDPHSVYIPKEEMQRVTENMQGDFVGIGINFYMYRDTLTVIRSVADGPSFAKGIQAGDKILMADTDTLFGRNLSSDAVVVRLKGIQGTTVKLKVYRKTTDSQFDVTIKRDRIPIRSVVAYYMVKPGMGYIKINRFAETTYDEFIEALEILQDNGARKLVLDLRDNPGGYLGIAEQMADEFLPDGRLILYTKNRKGEIDKSFASKRGKFEGKPIYVLINERSASASEIVAGALQDNDIGTIVGRRSFGKGLVQREMELGDGSAVRLTVSRYYTPTGRSIQRTYSNGSKDYYDEIAQRAYADEDISPPELSMPDSVPDSLTFTTPKGKLVYGGGGIIPDIFVPLGNNEEEAAESLDSLGFLSRFIFEYLEEDRSRFKTYTARVFRDAYRVDDILFERFINYCLRNKIKLSFYDYEDQLKTYLKAALAEQLFSPNLHAEIKGIQDPMLMKVLELDRPVISESEEDNQL